ncbi:TetR/AcrR family transcriptional regulator [Sphingobium subterraneum]|uniref:AcrR family transcriptional regulator n=1 Tax=Sphingobium subterraneum TaxID=627688 RepID=A0A841J0N1_9SPHN|nr:TetR/AcrR family transcriptional regulator [Sphingobium subterraneum]MBB6123086.1 AcrR family transcriptional regulator [Sphingobium subterraneum]
MSADTTLKISRMERRRVRNREAMITAGYQVMSEKGIDAATMSEIAEIADVGSGTVYNYFSSKDELAVAVMERVMHRLAERIEAVTDTFDDPGLIYAYGIRNVMLATVEDTRWRKLLNRSEVMADAMFRVMGPYAIRDIEAARAAGRYAVSNAELVWRMTTHAIMGFGLEVSHGALGLAALDDSVAALLGMVGVSPEAAREIVQRDWPRLPPE